MDHDVLLSNQKEINKVYQKEINEVYVIVKKYVKICVKLFKMLKCEFKLVYQTSPDILILVTP